MDPDRICSAFDTYNYSEIKKLINEGLTVDEGLRISGMKRDLKLIKFFYKGGAIDYTGSLLNVFHATARIILLRELKNILNTDSIFSELCLFFINHGIQYQPEDIMSNDFYGVLALYGIEKHRIKKLIKCGFPINESKITKVNQITKILIKDMRRELLQYVNY